MNDTGPPARRLPNPIQKLRAWARDRRRQGKTFLPFRIGAGSARIMLALLLSLAVLGVALILALRYTAPVATGHEISIDELFTASKAGAVKNAVLHDFDHRITGTLNDGTAVWATYPASDSETPLLITELVKGGAKPVTVDSQSNKQTVHFVATYILPLVLLANLFALIFVGTQGGGESVGGLVDFAGIGKGRGKKRNDDEGRITFQDVAGAQNAVVELVEVRDYLKDPERFAALGARPPKGVMLFGPPGCGKTLMARAVAGEAEVPFFSISGAEFVESLVGVGAARVRDLFRQVRAVAPAIVFIDEIDAAGRRRGGVAGGQEEREQTLNQLLIEMDGFEAVSGIVVIGATNRPDILDPALMRPGRFDRQITVEPPDLDGRAEILALYANRRPVEPDVDLTYFARHTPGFTGADLANVVNEAALLAVREGAMVISRALMEEAVQRVLTGPRRRGHLLSEEERLRAAYHESAHVLTAALTGRLGDIPRVTIVAHGKIAGSTVGRGFAERTLITRSELIGELVTVMSGTAAEELVFGEGSTGAEADLERATQLAHNMVGRYGMSTRLGKVHMLRLTGSELLAGDVAPTDLVEGEVLVQLHEEVRQLLDDADMRARQLLDEHRRLLDTIVERLLQHESLEGRDLAPLLDPVRGVAMPPVAAIGVNGRMPLGAPAPQPGEPSGGGGAPAR